MTRRTEYEIRKVANGYIVIPAAGRPPGQYYCELTDMFFFSAWSEASKWLRDQFEHGSEA